MALKFDFNCDSTTTHYFSANLLCQAAVHIRKKTDPCIQSLCGLEWSQNLHPQFKAQVALNESQNLHSATIAPQGVPGFSCKACCDSPARLSLFEGPQEICLRLVKVCDGFHFAGCFLCSWPCWGHWPRGR